MCVLRRAANRCRAKHGSLLAVLLFASLRSAAAPPPGEIFKDGFESGDCVAWSSAAPPETCNLRDDDCDGEVDEGFDGCLGVPFGAPPQPAQDDHSYPTSIEHPDIYLLIDRSGSMVSENTALKNSIGTIASGVTCLPNGTGSPSSCFEDPWWGVGTIGYSGSGGASYVNVGDISATTASFVGIPLTEPGGCCDETTLLATWAVITQLGSASSGCTIATAFAARANCNSSPAALGGFGGFGYPCFRDQGFPLVVIVTDETPISGTGTLHCPSFAAVIAPAATANGVHLAGVNSGAAAVATDLQMMATSSGAVVAPSPYTPLVETGVDAAATTALQTLLAKVATGGVPLDLSAAVVDDDGDAVDVVAAFVDHVEVLPLGTAECEDGLTTDDGDDDGHDETYVAAPTGTPLCWRIVLKQNATVAPTVAAQTFDATLRIVGNGAHLIYERPLTFVVPP